MNQILSFTSINYEIDFDLLLYNQSNDLFHCLSHRQQIHVADSIIYINENFSEHEISEMISEKLN